MTVTPPEVKFPSVDEASVQFLNRGSTDNLNGRNVCSHRIRKATKPYFMTWCGMIIGVVGYTVMVSNNVSTPLNLSVVLGAPLSIYIISVTAHYIWHRVKILPNTPSASFNLCCGSIDHGDDTSYNCHPRTYSKYSVEGPSTDFMG